MHQLIEHVRYPDKLLQKNVIDGLKGGIMSIETPEFAGLDLLYLKEDIGEDGISQGIFLFSI